MCLNWKHTLFYCTSLYHLSSCHVEPVCCDIFEKSFVHVVCLCHNLVLLPIFKSRIILLYYDDLQSVIHTNWNDWACITHHLPSCYCNCFGVSQIVPNTENLKICVFWLLHWLTISLSSLSFDFIIPEIQHYLTKRVL